MYSDQRYGHELPGGSNSNDYNNSAYNSGRKSAGYSQERHADVINDGRNRESINDGRNRESRYVSGGYEGFDTESSGYYHGHEDKDRLIEQHERDSRQDQEFQTRRNREYDGYREQERYSDQDRIRGQERYSDQDRFRGQDEFNNQKRFGEDERYSDQIQFREQNRFSDQDRFREQNQFSGQDRFEKQNHFNDQDRLEEQNRFSAQAIEQNRFSDQDRLGEQNRFSVEGREQNDQDRFRDHERYSQEDRFREQEDRFIEQERFRDPDEDYTSNRHSDLEKIAVEGLQKMQDYRDDHGGDDRGSRGYEMEKYSPARQTPTGGNQKFARRAGKQNKGFELEPDYDGLPDSTDSEEGSGNYLSGFDRTSAYKSSLKDKEKEQVKRASSYRNSGYAHEEIYEEIDPVLDNAQRQPKSRHEIREDYNELSQDGSEESLYSPRDYGRLLRRKSTVRMHTRRRSRFAKSNIESVPYTEAVKTMVRQRRAKSMFMPGAEHDLEPDYEDFQEKLPSQRINHTVTLTEKYKEMKRKRNVTSHEMATLLRDQILSREPSLLTGVALWKYQAAMSWLQFKNWSKNWIYMLELWAGSFKQIEGQFGTATMTYFRFLRWLMFLNLFMAIFLILIVLLPFLLLTPRGTHDFPQQVNRCLSAEHYYAWYFSVNYTDKMEAILKAEGAGEYVLDVLQGTGWMENTELFYGIYYNKTASIPGSEDRYTYNMSLAYLCAIAAGFLLSFVLLVKNSAKGFKERSVASGGGGGAGGGAGTLFCNKVFGAWDYCIALEKTAVLKHSNLRQDLLNELEYQKLEWKKASRTAKERSKLYAIRVAVNIFVLAVLSASLFLIYFTNEQLLKFESHESLNKFVLLLLQYLPSLTITMLNVMVPLIFNKVVIAEDYMPAYRTRITLTRIVLLRLASLGILMYSLYYTLTKTKPETKVDTPCRNLTLANTTTRASNVPCWETYVGQQIYKLVILNFLVVILVTFFWEYPRKAMFKKFHEKVKAIDLLGQQQFDLTKCVLDLIYLQALCWLGMFFSPMIPSMVCVELFIFFYVKKGSLLRNCLPVQQYGTSRSNSLFMTVLLLAFVLAAIPITVMISRIPPSKGCGPFRVYSSANYVMFDVVSNLVDSWEEAKHVFFFIGQGGVMVVVGFLLCMLMYYFYIVGQAHHKMTKTLRDQLKVEGQDKQFLLARVNEALEWEEMQKDNEDVD